jgi:hypothetical protein
MSPRLALPLILLLASSVACGGDDDNGTAPQLANLQITTSPVVRQQLTSVQVDVSDDEGLGGLQMELSLSGPGTLKDTVKPQGVTASMKNAQVTLTFQLFAAASSGTYTLSVVAIDGAGNRSSPLSTTFDLQ